MKSLLGHLQIEKKTTVAGTPGNKQNPACGTVFYLLKFLILFLSLILVFGRK